MAERPLLEEKGLQLRLLHQCSQSQGGWPTRRCPRYGDAVAGVVSLALPSRGSPNLFCATQEPVGLFAPVSRAQKVAVDLKAMISGFGGSTGQERGAKTM